MSKGLEVKRVSYLSGHSLRGFWGFDSHTLSCDVDLVGGRSSLGSG